MVLLSAAIVFAGLGWLSLSNSDGDNSGSAAPVAETTTQDPGTPSAGGQANGDEKPAAGAPAGSTSPGGTESGGSASGGASAGGTSAGAAAASPRTTGDSAAAMNVPVRVYNNSTVEGLAATTADELRADGWNVTDVSNYDSGQVPRSAVFYGPKQGEREAAEKLAQSMGLPVEPRFDGITDAPSGVIVILAGNSAD